MCGAVAGHDVVTASTTVCDTNNNSTATCCKIDQRAQ